MTARTYKFVQLDVFTRTPFIGNPLAVFTDARGLTDKEMPAPGAPDESFRKSAAAMSDSAIHRRHPPNKDADARLDGFKPSRFAPAIRSPPCHRWSRDAYAPQSYPKTSSTSIHPD